MGVFLGLSKEFDTINHDILLAKLYYCAIGGIANDRFKSYFSDRNHIIDFNGTLSSSTKCNMEFYKNRKKWMQLCLLMTLIYS